MVPDSDSENSDRRGMSDIFAQSFSICVFMILVCVAIWNFKEKNENLGRKSVPKEPSIDYLYLFEFLYLDGNHY